MFSVTTWILTLSPCILGLFKCEWSLRSLRVVETASFILWGDRMQMPKCVRRHASGTSSSIFNSTVPLPRLLLNISISYGWKEARTWSHLAAPPLHRSQEAPRRSITAPAKHPPPPFLFKCHWWDVRLVVCSQTAASSNFSLSLSLWRPIFFFPYRFHWLPQLSALLFPEMAVNLS